MSTDTPPEHSSSGTDDSIELQPRTRRALERPASVLHTDGTPVEAGDEPTIVVVISGNSGREHTIDVRESRCTCEDHKHRGVECWHLRRAAIALGDRVLDARELEAADVDSHLAANAPGPAVATSDGGIIEGTAEDAEILEDDESDDVEGPTYTYHRESPDVGGARYVRCEHCGRESVPADPDRLLHRRDCPESDRDDDGREESTGGQDL